MCRPRPGCCRRGGWVEVAAGAAAAGGSRLARLLRAVAAGAAAADVAAAAGAAVSDVAAAIASQAGDQWSLAAIAPPRRLFRDVEWAFGVVSVRMGRVFRTEFWMS